MFIVVDALSSVQLASFQAWIKNPDRRGAHQLAIYKRDGLVELESVKKQRQLLWLERDLNPWPRDLKSGTLTTRQCCIQQRDYKRSMLCRPPDSIVKFKMPSAMISSPMFTEPEGNNCRRATSQPYSS